jgi:hypothetical protein
MAVEEIEICKDCGKQVRKLKGSITQWMGLGDTCKCWLDQLSITSTFQRQKGMKKGRKCRRCLKPISSNQSMTQWLFKKEGCQCSPEHDVSGATDYTQKALSGRSTKVLRKTDNRPIIALVSVGILVVAFILFFFIFDGVKPNDLGQAFQSWGSPSEHDRKERFLTLQLDQNTTQTYKMPDTAEQLDCTPIRQCREIVFRNSAITDEELSALAIYGSMFKVTLLNCRGFSAKGVKHLTAIDNLKNIDFDCSEMNQEILDALGESHLNLLDLSRTKIADYDWSGLLRNKSLETLRLKDVVVSKRNLDALLASGFVEEGHSVFRRSQAP